VRADGALDLFGEDLVDEHGEFDIKRSETDAAIVSRWFFCGEPVTPTRSSKLLAGSEPRPQ
jgi:hypothetical protein